MGSVISPLRDNIIYVGEWQLNISLQTINDGVHARELEPLLFKLLCYFIEHNERIISRQELADNIWQQSYVDDNAINRAISELRKALKSEKQPGQSIKTHYRKGYSLFIPVSSNKTETVTTEQQNQHESSSEVAAAESSSHSHPKRNVNWSWSIPAILIATLICFFWFFSDKPAASSETRQTMPFLALDADTISWHKGSYSHLLLPPDKSKLAYLLTPLKQNDIMNIYVMDLKTKKEFLVDSGDAYIQGWSDDGLRLFYVKCKPGDYSQCQQWQASDFFSETIKKSPLSYPYSSGDKLTQYTEVGDTAIFRRNHYRGLSQLFALYAYDKKTAEEIRITSPNITGTGDFLLTTLSNPERIIFERHNTGQAEIYMANLDGSSMKLLTTNNYRSWAATYDEPSNSLIWYNRANSTIESFSFDSMTRAHAIKAPVKDANYAYPLNKESLLISTDLHDLDASVFDLKTHEMSYIATANKHENSAVALANGDVYFADTYYDKREHWLKTNNQYIPISDRVGTDNIIVSANENSTRLLSFNKHTHQLSLLDATDFKTIKQWQIPGRIVLAKIRKNRIAVIYADATTLQNQLMLLNTDNTETLISTIDTPLAIAWRNDHQLIVHAKHTQFLELDSQTNHYHELPMPDKLTAIKPSIVTMASNEQTLFIATSANIYSAALEELTEVNTLIKMKPSNYILHLNAQNEKLAISFVTANNQNSIELYTEKRPSN